MPPEQDLRLVKLPSGYEMVFVDRAIVSHFGRFIHPEIPWVWILGHMPNPALQWWRSELPVNPQGVQIRADFRQISYDLMLPIGEFLANLTAFDEHGIVFVQSYQRMPDTLQLAGIPDQQLDRILIQNGAFLRVYLPHALEIGAVTCYQTGYLQKLVEGQVSDRQPAGSAGARPAETDWLDAVPDRYVQAGRAWKEVHRGEIYWVPLGAQDDAEPGYIHPHVVIQDDVLNRSRIHTVVVCALTTNIKRAKAPGNVLLEAGEANLPKQSVVVVSQVSVVEKTQLGEYIGSLSEPRVNQILAGMQFLQSMTGYRETSVEA